MTTAPDRVKALKSLDLFLLVFLSAALAGGGLGYLMGRTQQARIDAMQQRDTTYVSSVKEVPVPGPVATTIIRDTVVSVRIVHDTVAVHLPVIRRTYDTEDYTAVISGPVAPVLETMRVKTVTQVVTRTVAMPYRWAVTPYAGADVMPGIARADIGVEVAWGISSKIRVAALAGYAWTNAGTGWDGGPSVGIRVMCDLARGQ